VRGLRVAIVIGICALGCAKRPGPDSAAAPGIAAHAPPRKGADEEETSALETDASPVGAGDAAGFSPVVETTPATLEELTAALDDYEADLRAVGLRLKTYRKDKSKQTPHGKRVVAPTKPAADGDATKKAEPRARICAIAASVCELRSRICTLADEHEGEPRYAAACKRATTDCNRASEACDEGD